jgi:hypothetical protein
LVRLKVDLIVVSCDQLCHRLIPRLSGESRGKPCPVVAYVRVGGGCRIQ